MNRFILIVWNIEEPTLLFLQLLVCNKVRIDIFTENENRRKEFVWLELRANTVDSLIREDAELIKKQSC